MSNILAESYNKPFLHSMENIVTEVNEAFVNLVGYSENELLGRSLTEISKLIRIDLQMNLQEVKSESKHFIFNKTPDSIEVSIIIKFLDDQNDKILYFTEQPHYGCNQMFDFVKSIFTDRMTGVACRIFPSLVLIKADQNFIGMLEEPFNTRDNCLGKNNELIYGGTEIYSTILRTGGPYYCEEIEYNHKDKGVIYYNSIFIQGELRYLVQAILDVTDKVMRRRDIEQKNKELEAIFENMTDELIIFDKNGEYTRMNKAARDNPSYDFTESKGFRKSFEKANYFDIDRNTLDFDNLPFNRGLSYPELNIIGFNNRAFNELMQINQNTNSLLNIMGLNVLDLNILSKEDHTYEALWNSLQKKEQSISFIRKFIMSDIERYFRVVIQPLYGLNNEVLEIIGISIDITNEVISKNKMEETLKMQDELFVNLSHELKTPLNVIFSASQLMDLYIDNTSGELFKSKFLNNNNIIKQNCYRLIKLINNIVDYSKIESGYLKLNLSNENIVDTVENMVQ